MIGALSEMSDKSQTIRMSHCHPEAKGAESARIVQSRLWGGSPDLKLWLDCHTALSGCMLDAFGLSIGMTVSLPMYGNGRIFLAPRPLSHETRVALSA